MQRIVVFDVDGVLLHLTPAEEEGFFLALREIHGLDGLSRDWDSYRIRNDVDIVAEILGRHLGRPAAPAEIEAWRRRYLAIMVDWLERGVFAVEPVAGAAALLRDLRARGVAVGIATANLIDAAHLRLARAGLWNLIDHAEGADAGGPKRVLLGRLLARLDVPRSGVVYVGDNLNDVEAGLEHANNFIGFSVDADRRRKLAAHGAHHVAASHDETRRLIGTMFSELFEERTS
jgi:phosphoglycolate phosphatase-like HAD superfamily hydrolase